MHVEESPNHDKATLVLRSCDLDRYTAEEIFSAAEEEVCFERGRDGQGVSVRLPGRKGSVYRSSAELGEAIQEMVRLNDGNGKEE